MDTVLETLKKQLGRRYGLKTKKEKKQVKLSDFATPLVTVELPFFEKLWRAWLCQSSRTAQTQ